MLAADDLAVAAATVGRRPPSTTAVIDAVAPRPRLTARRDLVERRGRSSPPSRSSCFALAVRRVDRLEAGVRAARRRRRCSTELAVRLITDGTVSSAVGVTITSSGRSSASRLASSSASPSASLVACVEDRPLGDRLDDHRPADDAVDRLVPAGHPAVPARPRGRSRFVVVLGAAPSIANGLITGVDHVPPLLLRAGRVIGARGVSAYRHVILPASLPSFVGGLKQGWAFAWRSLMAGELLVIIASKPSIGQQMQQARSLSRYSDMIAWMVVVFVIGLLVDAVAFGTLDRAIRRRWGLLTD